MKFVRIPGNPVNAAKVLVAQNTPSGVLKGLKKLNIEPVFGAKTNFEVEAVRCHIDTQIVHIGGNRFVAMPQLAEYYKSVLNGAEIISGKSRGQGSYPDDAAYNVANTGKFAICNLKYTDKVVLDNLTCDTVNVPQGYAKCSVCIVDENSVITEDAGIARSLERYNIDVLKISAGDVKLDGMDYGFLGGASGKLSENILAFTGDIATHRDFEKIVKFCQGKNVTPVSLCEGPLTDIGSIIPVADKE